MNDEQRALIASLEAREEQPVFARFDDVDAWRLGNVTVAAAYVAADQIPAARGQHRIDLVVMSQDIGSSSASGRQRQLCGRPLARHAAPPAPLVDSAKPE